MSSEEIIRENAAAFKKFLIIKRNELTSIINSMALTGDVYEIDDERVLKEYYDMFVEKVKKEN